MAFAPIIHSTSYIMNTYRLLVTYADGSLKELVELADSQRLAMNGALESLPSDGICSIDFLTPDCTPELAKARKSKRRPSRADRYSMAQGKVSDGRAEFEELRDELQSWRDNLPEGLQDSQKANDLDDAISELDDAANSCEEIEGKDVTFPGMFG